MTSQALADALPDGVVVADAGGTVVLISAMAGRMIGVRPGAAGSPV